MEMRIRFPGGRKVSADFNGLTLLTDQPKAAGGDGGAPTPFELFLASIGACAGIFVLGFCLKRGIASGGIELIETIDWDDAKHRVSRIAIEIVLPDDFPEKYRDGAVNAANLCTVKKHLLNPPAIEVRARGRTTA